MMSVSHSSNISTFANSPITSHDEVSKLLPSASELQRVSYVVYISTANSKGAGTHKDVNIRLVGDLSTSELILLHHSNSSVQSSLVPQTPVDRHKPSPRDQKDRKKDDMYFPVATTRQFSFRTRDVGNLLRIYLQHDSTAPDASAAWKPNRIVVENELLHRSWSFLCPRWLSFDQGNIIDLYPGSEIAVGRRASTRASRRISSVKPSRLLSMASPAKKIVEAMRDRFSLSPETAAETMQSSTHSGTRRVLFQLQRYSQTASHLYLIGSIPALGKWCPEHACRMTQHCPFDGRWRGDWRLELEIDDDYDEIHYRYMVVREGESPSSRVATFTHPMRELKLSALNAQGRNTEGGRIYVKDVFHGAPNSQATLSPSRPARYSTPAIISTPRGSAVVVASDRDGTPMANMQHLFGVQRDLTAALESSTADPVSSETSVSNKATPRPLPSAATEESSAPIDDSETDGDQRTNEQATDDSPNRSWVEEELEFGTAESSWTTSRARNRRQSADISSDAPMASQVRANGDMVHTSFEASHTESAPDQASPFSSADLTHANGVMDSTESSTMRKQRDDLQIERDDLRKQLDAMKLELDSVRASKETALESGEPSNIDSEAMGQERDALVAERDQLHQERDQLRHERDQLRHERDQYLKECDVFREERDAHCESSDELRDERDAMRAERDAALENFDTLQSEKDGVLAEREKLLSERKALQQERDGLKEQQHGVSEERDALAAELEHLKDVTTEKTEKFSKISSTHNELMEELDSLRTEVVVKREEFDAQSAELRNIVEERQKEFDESLQAAEEDRLILHDRWAKEFKIRRKLFNQIQEMRGNIRVFCRVRPLKYDDSGTDNMAVSFPDADIGENGRITLGGKQFEFDEVFQPSSTQEQVYNETAGVVASVLDGYNVCVFAYGQTGSGKTYTMDGSECNRGVNFRALENLFQIANDRKDHSNVSISVSMLEIYNEVLRDLILENGCDNGPKLEIRRDPHSSSANGVYVPNLTEVEVESFQHTWDVMMQGSRNRSQGRTDMNEHSSRSHLLLRVTVRCEDFKTGVKSSGVLHLVDLAGSERISRSHASGERLKEAQHINKSLSSLGDVFSALTSNSGHIPYRNSRLTYLLQDCLGGDSKTLMFVNVSCDEADASETTSSLLFAQRVAKVELGNAKKHTEKTVDVKTTAALHEKESENSELHGKISTLQREMKKRDECILDMRQRVRTMESEVATAKRLADEQVKKECTGREGSVREVKTLRAELERSQAEMKSENNRLAQMVQTKDGEIQNLQAKLSVREKETTESTTRKSKDDAGRSRPDRERDSSAGPSGRMERLTSAPVLGRSERPNTRIPRTSSAITGRPPRSVRFDDNIEASANPPGEKKASVEAPKPTATGNLKPATTSLLPKASTVAGTSGSKLVAGSAPARRAKDVAVNTGVRNGLSSGLPRAATVRGSARTPASGTSTVKKPVYAFGSRVDGNSTDKPSTTSRPRVPRSQTAILRPPQRASAPASTLPSSGLVGRNVPASGRVTSSLKRAGTSASGLGRTTAGAGGTAK